MKINPTILLFIVLFALSSCDTADAVFDSITVENKGITFYQEKAVNTTDVETTSITSVSLPPETAVVFVTQTGKKYHYSATCAGKNAKQTTLAYEISIGKEPCKKCVK